MAKARFTHPFYLLFFGFLAIWMPGFLLASAQGAGFEVLRNFSRSGVAPSGLVFGPNGNLYGTTNTGGESNYGTLYSVNPQTGEVTTIANFGGFAGTNPHEQIAADGTSVYGVSDSGQIIWRWNAESGLARIGVFPVQAFYDTVPGVASDNSGGLVGMRISGFSGGTSKLWRWSPSTGLTELDTFVQATTGPLASTKLAVDSQGGIYGCSALVNQKTILWRWKAVAGFEKLAELPVDTFGASVPGVSIDANDHVWGRTSTGGAHQDGTLWRWTLEGGAEKLGDFNSPDTGRRYASPITFTADGTPISLSGNIIWKWTAADGLANHANLSSPEIGVVGGAIALDDAGAFFGTSGFGSPTGHIWKWTAAGGVVKLADSPDASVAIINRGLARDAQGRLYGATSSPEEPTMLWRWSNAGGYQELATFDPALYGLEKTFPTLDSGGNVYGILERNGIMNQAGKLWRWNAAEGLIKLADLHPLNQGFSESKIVIGSDGTIYGTGRSASISIKGPLLWRRTASGEFPTAYPGFGLYNYGNAYFSLGQVTGPNGEWYGTQLSGVGLWSSSSGGHGHPPGGGHLNETLTRDAAGNIYGTTGSSSSSTPSTLWKWNKAAGFSTLATFDQSTGIDPVSLFADSSGFMIRGVCSAGGANGAGTIWIWTQQGGLRAIHHFDSQNPVPTNPSALVEDNDGNLCGLVDGLLWRYVMGPGPAITLSGGTPNQESVAFTGTVSPDGFPATVKLQWGETADSFVDSGQVVSVSGASNQSLSFELSGLPQNRTLFARLVAVGSQGGVSVSNIVSFTSPNRRPEAVPDVVHSPALSEPYFTVDVLANDSDPGDTLTLLSLEQGKKGTAEIVDNKIRYTPGPSYQGEDSITYTVSDGHGGSAQATLSFYNHRPEAVPDVVHGPALNEIGFMADVLVNDSDTDPGDTLTLVSLGQGGHGFAEIVDNRIRYTPGPSYRGEDSIAYTVSDGRGGNAQATLTLYNGLINAQSDVVARGQGDLTILPLANDGDADGDVLRIVSVTQPKYSTVTFSDGALIYHPSANAFGSEYFTYTVTDSRGGFAIGGVEVRSSTVDVRAVLSLAQAIETSPGKAETVRALGSAGTALGGMLRVQTGFKPLTWILLNPENFSELLRPGKELAGMPGMRVRSIEEPAGRAVLVKFASDEAPKKLREALLFFNNEGEQVVISYEGADLADESRVLSIDRYSEANGHVFLLTKLRQKNGKTVQSLRVWQNGQTEELIRGGTTTVNNFTVKSIKTLVPIAGSPAVNRWIDDNGRIAALLTLANGRKAVAVCQAGHELSVVASTPLGFDGSKILELGPPVLGANRTAFRQVSIDPLSARSIALWHSDPNSALNQFAKVGGSATEEPPTRFTGLADPVAGANDSYAFMCSVRNDLGDPAIRTWKALCWQRGLERHLVNPQNLPLPKGRPGTIKSVAMSPQSTRGPIFTMMSSKGLGLWATNDVGTPIVLASPGQILTIGGEQRTVLAVRALEGSSGRGIANRAFDGSGRVQAILKFDNFETALVEFALP